MSLLLYLYLRLWLRVRLSTPRICCRFTSLFRLTVFRYWASRINRVMQDSTNFPIFLMGREEILPVQQSLYISDKRY